MNPKYPIYIISKGRSDTRYTSRALDGMGVDYRIVIEPQEFVSYAQHIDQRKILKLPFSNLGKGSIPARNWVWEHSISEGHKRHWIMDDNLVRFYRFNKNTKHPCGDGTIFHIMENCVDRYLNVPMAGPNYEHFVNSKEPKTPPIRLNTRVYSCILLSNEIPLRWRGRYNEDTDLSLRILKSGMCTILFNAFTANKVATMNMKGGNTDELYKQDQVSDGRLKMAKSLQRQHPDVTKVVYKWRRWQHSVDYSPFKKNKLIRDPSVEIPEGVDNYGMKLISKETGEEINL